MELFVKVHFWLYLILVFLLLIAIYAEDETPKGAKRNKTRLLGIFFNGVLLLWAWRVAW